MNQKEKKFIAVIGNRNAGKSTIIVSLTGCPNRSYRGMVRGILNNEEKSIYVIASSPQEQRLDKDGDGLESERKAFQSILTQIRQNSSCIGLVMAIQPIKKPTKRLSLEAIVKEVQKTKTFEPYLFVLQPDRNNSLESQQIETEINRRLRDTGIVLDAQGLDGRRFAFLNARYINQLSQLFI